MRFTALQIDINQLRGAYKIVCDTIFEKLHEVIRRAGGEVDMTDESCDNAYTVVYLDGNDAVETQITAVRANDDGSIDYKCKYFGDEWYSLRYDEHEYHKALLDIAENIFQYIPIEDDRTD